MTTLTIEINHQQDLQKIVDFVQNLGAKVIKTENTVKEPVDIETLASFYQKFQFETKDFQFDRDEANER